MQLSGVKHEVRESREVEERRKQLCRWETKRLIKRGEIAPQPCEKCGEEKGQAHHEDYSDPRRLRWLCKSCHIVHHGIERRKIRRAGKRNTAFDGEWLRVGEAAQLAGLKVYELRHLANTLPEVRPITTRGGHRRFSRAAVEFATRLRRLTREDGYARMTALDILRDERVPLEQGAA